MTARRGERIQYYDEVVMTYKGEACLPWPFGVNDRGRPLYRRDGQTKNAARYICEDVNGPPMLPGLEAEHTCGNKMCVNPGHIDWNTSSGNSLRKKEHGTMPNTKGQKRTKYTVEIILAIRADRAAGMTLKAISEKHGVPMSSLDAIVARRTWKNI